MFDCSSKLAIFIDGAVLHATAKTLGFDVDYKRLGQEFANRGARVSPVSTISPDRGL